MSISLSAAERLAGERDDHDHPDALDLPPLNQGVETYLTSL